jgi:hypothetical protein
VHWLIASTEDLAVTDQRSITDPPRLTRWRFHLLLSAWNCGLRSMPTQTVSRTVESDSEPIEIYNVLAEVSNIPKWAPVFADAIERIDDTHYIVTKNGETFNLELFLHPSAGTVDYIREMPNNKRGGAYVRVVPRPRGGSAITMILPIGPNTNESDIARTLEQELTELIRLART